MLLSTHPLSPLRKAQESLSRGASSTELVMDSLPYGGDAADTLEVLPSEITSLAEKFAAMPEPEVPSAPTVTCIKTDYFKSYNDNTWFFATLWALSS